MTRKITPTGVLVAPSGIPENEWLALRRTGIGGSDIAALLGMSQYTSPYEVYLDKRGELPDLPRSEFLMRAAYWGHRHEELIAERFAEHYGVRTRRIGLIRHVQEAWRLASLDRQVFGCDDGPCLLEIKNRSAWKASEWGPSETEDGVPDREALQTHWYLGVTGYRHAHVGVLINGNDDRFYRIDYDSQIDADVTGMARDFWRGTQNGIAPPMDGAEASRELLASLWTGTQDGTRSVDRSEVIPLLSERKRLKDAAKELDGQITEAENKLKLIIGDDEIAADADAERLYTWKQNGAFAAKRFREEHPDLAEKYTHLVSVLDDKALASDKPELHRSYRARVLRTIWSAA